MQNPEVLNAKRLCFFAHFDVDALVDDYVLHYLRSLRAAGFATVLVSTSRLAASEIARLEGLCADVIVRENHGLDFGGWADCVARYPDLAPDLLLLCNDSAYGPFWNFSDFIDDLISRPADFYGAVFSLGDAADDPHVQSWFLLLRPSAYRSATFRDMLGRPVPAALSKNEIIDLYEKQFARRLQDEGLTFRCAFDPREQGLLLTRYPINTAYVLWEEMLTHRILPFVKIQAIRSRALWGGRVRKWYDVVRAFDPALAEMARANMRRRDAHVASHRFGSVRDRAFALMADSALIPPLRNIIARDMAAAHEGGGHARGAARARSYAIGRAVHRAFLLPYKWTYQTISRWRRAR